MRVALGCFVVLASCGGDSARSADADADSDSDSDSDSGCTSGCDCNDACDHQLDCDPEMNRIECDINCACLDVAAREDAIGAYVDCLATWPCGEGDPLGGCALEATEGLARSDPQEEYYRRCTELTDCPADAGTIPCDLAWILTDDGIAELLPCFDSPTCAEVVDCARAAAGRVCLGG